MVRWPENFGFLASSSQPSSPSNLPPPGGPPTPAAMLERHSLTGFHVRIDLVDLCAVQRSSDAQHTRQRHQDIAVRRQQITGCDVAVRDGTVEVLNRNDHHMLDAKDHDGSMSHLGDRRSQ